MVCQLDIYFTNSKQKYNDSALLNYNNCDDIYEVKTRFVRNSLTLSRNKIIVATRISVENYIPAGLQNLLSAYIILFVVAYITVKFSFENKNYLHVPIYQGYDFFYYQPIINSWIKRFSII